VSEKQKKRHTTSLVGGDSDVFTNTHKRVLIIRCSLFALISLPLHPPKIKKERARRDVSTRITAIHKKKSQAYVKKETYALSSLRICRWTKAGRKADSHSKHKRTKDKPLDRRPTTVSL
jgi:hypothetical protein